jgi:crotonobetainyl-CoA:carnitine CoA-transferase CaiB-like acyl-CoA transferase
MGALDGIRVIQTAAAAAGPMASRFLADWGADVICVEYTARRAQVAQRRAAPQMTGRRSIVSDIDFNAQNLNRNKRSMTLNLSLWMRVGKSFTNYWLNQMFSCPTFAHVN